ncbi:MAG: LysM peptidoglycan-binding domain-containing protein, partial [Candidatus Melainabacteria bacterium]|nr:LysM peptidoglycan-binding domain-containing protein [Candidatus Melainabacteria bacterium]
KDPTDPKDPADDPQDPAKPEKPEDNVQRSHTIERGDTIWRICADELRSRSGKSPSHMEIIGAVEAVKKMNPDVDPYRLRAGDELKIPKDLSCPPGAEFIPHPRPPRRPVEPPIAVPRRPPVEPPIAAPPDERPGPVPPIESRPPLEREREPEMTNADVLREHWDGIDRDSNGKVSREEINEYRRVMSRYLSDKQDDALRLMAQNEHKIQELVNDEKGDENSGISLADLRKAEVMQTAARYFQSKNLDMINFNGDRFIDQRELHYASNSPYVTARDQQMLKVLRAYYANFQEGSNNEDGDENSGITRHDLRYYSNLI